MVPAAEFSAPDAFGAAPAPRGARGRAWLGAAAIVLATLTAYAPVRRAGFVWDDDDHFIAVRAIAEGSLADVWRDHPFYYPLTSTTWWVLRRLVGLDPLPYHLLNVVLHAVNAILLWRVVRRLGIPGAWWAGALFALHPVHVQSVAWATELKNLQSGLFFLLALRLWAGPDGPGGRLPWRRVAAAAGCFVVALLSKTSTVVLPLGLVLVDLWRRRPLDRATAARWVPFFALGAAAGVWTLLGHEPMVQGTPWHLTAAQRLALAGRCVWFYLGKLLWPADLSFVYERWTIDPTQPAAWGPAVALAATFAALIAGRRRGGRPALLALGWHVAMLLPVLNFFRMYYAAYSYVADHWQYLASMGPIVWAAGTAAAGAARLREPALQRVAAAAGVLALAVAAARTAQQATHYRDAETLWLAVLAHDPRSEVAYNNLAAVYLEQGRLDEAESILRRALNVFPREPDLLTMLAAALLHRQRWAEAESLLTRALAHQPDDPDALNNLGLARAGQGRTDDAATAFRAALARDPFRVEVYNNLIKTLLEAGRRGEARAVLDQALQRLPGHPLLLQLRSVVESGGGAADR